MSRIFLSLIIIILSETLWRIRYFKSSCTLMLLIVAYANWMSIEYKSIH